MLHMVYLGNFVLNKFFNKSSLDYIVSLPSILAKYQNDQRSISISFIKCLHFKNSVS